MQCLQTDKSRCLLNHTVLSETPFGYAALGRATSCWKSARMSFVMRREGAKAWAAMYQKCVQSMCNHIDTQYIPKAVLRATKVKERLEQRHDGKAWSVKNARPLDFCAIHGVFILYICRFWDHALPCSIQHLPPALCRRNGQKRSTVLRASPVLIFSTWYISYALETEAGLPRCVLTSAALQFPALCGVYGTFASRKISFSAPLSKVFYLLSL